MDDTSAAVRQYVASQHGDLLEQIAACADATVESWDAPTTPDRDAVVTPLQVCLERTGVAERLPDVLAGAVDAAGRSLQAQPVAAPPYVVITSVGPVLRGTTDGGRVVITLRVFAVRRRASGSDTRYVRIDDPIRVDAELK